MPEAKDKPQKAVTLDDVGPELYRKIALAGGFGDISDRNWVNAPPLDVGALTGTHKAAVDALLSGAKEK